MHMLANTAGTHTLITCTSVSGPISGSGAPRQAVTWRSANGRGALSRPSSRARLSTGLAYATASSIGKQKLFILELAQENGYRNCVSRI